MKISQKYNIKENNRTLVLNYHDSPELQVIFMYNSKNNSTSRRRLKKASILERNALPASWKHYIWQLENES